MQPAPQPTGPRPWHSLDAAVIHPVPMGLGPWLRVALTASLVCVLVEAGELAVGRQRGGDGPA